MATSPENTSMAVFCDFENVALGVRDANYEKFDIKLVLERLLLKGSIVVKKAYCDWERYKSFKGTMHEANFELIEIPHLRMSGKNSADIRLVVDALDLCYTKSHVNTFVIVSGDSDFSPLVSKLRENAKQVIGVGVKQSTSDLLIANCDEFIFYDDLVREVRRQARRERSNGETQNTPRRTPEEEQRRKEDLEKRRSQAIEIAVETLEALVAERDDGGKIWASVLKQAIKRRKPDFNENYYGFRTFGNLIEEAQTRGLLDFGRDEKSNTYVFRASGERPVSPAAPARDAQPLPASGALVQIETTSQPNQETPVTEAANEAPPAVVPGLEPKPESDSGAELAKSAESTESAAPTTPAAPPQKRQGGQGARKPARQAAKENRGTRQKAAPEQPVSAPAAPRPPAEAFPVTPPDEAAVLPQAQASVPEALPKKKPATRPRRPRKPAAGKEKAGENSTKSED